MARFSGKFKSAKQEWETPQELFQKLNEEFEFEIDLAASSENTKCQRFFTSEDNALSKVWRGICWLNPPYGEASEPIQVWVRKAYESGFYPGCTVVMLVPARTNTNWWHDFCMRAAEVRFIRGRPKFGGAKHGLPQPLAIVVFEDTGKPTKFSSWKIVEGAK